MIEQIKKEAIAAYPKEAVWLQTEKGVYQVENIHEDPENFFRVSAKDTLKANQEGLKAVIHSHCDRPHVPSKSDMEGQQLTAVPWGILQTDGENASDIIWWGEEHIPPLEGRPFIHGVSDCFSLFRDFYRLEYGHDIGDVPRDWKWWEQGFDLIGSLYAGKGFYEISVDDLRRGDAMLIGFGTDYPHHCAIYLGDELMIHHPGTMKAISMSNLSVIEPVFRYLPHVISFHRWEGSDD